MGRVPIPAPLLVLVAAAVVSNAIPGLHAPSERVVEDVVSAALIYILFDGGLDIGMRRFRAAAVPIGVVGLLGTFLTAGGAAVLLHYGCGLDWYVAVLVATAVAPTDPAVVFSVLGQRRISGRSGTILEGESGANDPVGIALMVSLLAAGELSAKAAGQVALTFVLQMVVGAAIGVIGGFALLRAITHARFSSRVFHVALMCVGAAGLYALASLAHGSGFLAVFVAGIVLGDEPARFKREIVSFLDSVSGVAEIVAFVALGLTIDVGAVVRADVLVPGLLAAAALALVIRPIAVRACLLGAGLERNEIVFVLFAGLKGAVPLLLGELIRGADLSEPERLYGIVVVVVVCSVLVQGSLTPVVAHALRLPRTDQRTL